MKSITGKTDKVGVWISGFFGSGKSHFLKILSYLLDNKTVDGKTAYEYFEQGKKFSDSLFLADIKRVADTSTDVILFNIDAKGKRDESLAVTFLKVFNEHLGYYADNLRISALERDMDKDGQYQLFSDNFEKVHGSSWKDSRHRSDFIEDDIVKTLEITGIMSETAARTWYQTVHDTFDISIREFAKIVQTHIEEQGDNHHVVFMVDEVGQYIADDAKLMLNLQTIAEEFGSISKGQAWVIVTSQQNIDDLVTVKEDDFSKIQGRFDTRLSLSSAHADEVIRRRILEKKEHSRKMLEGLYEEKRTAIGNLIIFDDGTSEQKLYSTPERFSEDYPFVPYQFDLVASTLQSIRIHGASGKHLSEGERSMLSLFQESAARLKNETLGVLVPYNQYYSSLVQFIDHSHAAVIDRASRNEHLKDETGESYAVEVLKTLFLIKYVTGMKSTANNITSLMVSHIDDDRIKLQKMVETALEKLVREALVQKNTDTYVFLTNEEQEINRAISTIQIEQGEIHSTLGKFIFEDILRANGNKIPHPRLGNQYPFTYKTAINDHSINVRGDELSLRIITPEYSFFNDGTHLRQLSRDNKEVVAELSHESPFLDEVKNYLRTDKFLRSESTRNMKDFSTIQGKKTEELEDSRKRCVQMIEDSLRFANVYINGSPRELNHSEVSSRIEEAMGILLEEVYIKLGAIETVKGLPDVKEALTAKPVDKIGFTGMNEDNHIALGEMERYLQLNATNASVSLKSLKSSFTNPPYGFKPNDTLWLLAVLFRNEEISFYFNGELQDSRSDKNQIFDYITRSTNDEKTLITKREKASKQSKENVRELLRNIFGKATATESDSELYDAFQQETESMIRRLEKHLYDYDKNQDFSCFPDKQVLTGGISLLRKISGMKDVFGFYHEIEDYRDDLLSFKDDYEELREFLDNDDQRKLFAVAVKYYGFFRTNESFISEENLLGTAQSVKTILDMPQPYHQIHLLNQYNPKLEDLLMEQLKRSSKEPLQVIDEELRRVLNNAEDLDFPEKETFKIKVQEAFKGLKTKIAESNSILEINGVPTEAKVKTKQFYSELDVIREKLAILVIEEEEAAGEAGEPATIQASIPKTRKSISLRELSPARHWELESTEDIDKHLNTVRAKLIEALDENTILEVEL